MKALLDLSCQLFRAIFHTKLHFSWQSAFLNILSFCPPRHRNKMVAFFHILNETPCIHIRMNEANALGKLWVMHVLEVCFERALWLAEAQWLRYFVHDSNSLIWNSLLVGWLIWSNQITTNFAWPRKPLFYRFHCQEKLESLFEMPFFIRAAADRLDWCRFESGREQIWNTFWTSFGSFCCP